MLRLLVLVAMLSLTTSRAQAQEPAPATSDSESADPPSDFMTWLAQRGRHDLREERWNAYGQFTYISNLKLPFDAPYTNESGTPNSLSPRLEHAFTATLTLFLGLKLWHGGELYVTPELVSMQPLSGLKGLGGAIQNFELQKNGTPTPLPYLPRGYLQQTFAFGGQIVEQPSDPMQLASPRRSRRLTLTLGKLSVLDVFDRNAYASDLRRQFLNMSFMTYAAYDFAADSRGYALGAIVEYEHDDWALRVGRFTPPKQPNQQSLDFRIHEHYGDQFELEHEHEFAELAGAVRLLFFRNREVMGRFDDAVAVQRADATRSATTCLVVPDGYESTNANAPDLCWARRLHTKWGLGASIEQSLGRDIGLFARGMFADGRTEVYSYTSTDRSLSFGLLAQGTAWRRHNDVFGFGHSAGFISKAHARYLARGGLDGFIGDGALRRGAERVTELFYSVNILRALWASLDYQHLRNPAYNRARGPVDIFGVRAHAEF